MQIWAESGKSALPICNYSQILYQFLTFTQNLKRSRTGININAVSSGIIFCKYCSHRILSPYRSINYLLQKSEAFQSVHHVTFILCYTVLYNFFGLRCRFGRHRAEVHRTSCALVFSLIRVRKHWWDDITQGKQ